MGLELELQRFHPKPVSTTIIQSIDGKADVHIVHRLTKSVRYNGSTTKYIRGDVMSAVHKRGLVTHFVLA